MKNIFFLVALFFSVQASAVPLNTIVVFGDSLSDNGNLYEYMKRELPLSPPYFAKFVLLPAALRSNVTLPLLRAPLSFCAPGPRSGVMLFVRKYTCAPSALFQS